jgi:hypothetical protein
VAYSQGAVVARKVLQPLFAWRSCFADPLLFPDQNCTGARPGSGIGVTFSPRSATP